MFKEGYSFTTSVSIRLLPGLGDDIFVFLFFLEVI